MNKVLVRLKNPKVIVGVVSGVSLILVNLGVIDIEMSDKIAATVDSLLVIGVGIGIFGNPDSHIK